MEKIEIGGQLDRSWIASLMAEGYDTYQILKNYELTEDLIIECSDLLDKQVLLQGFVFSEQFLRNCLETEFILSTDLENLNMGTYASLSSSFIEEYTDLLNWNRIMVYLSTQTNTFTNYISVIEEKNLWDLISANDLSIDFIRKYKQKLNWELMSITKCFTEEEKEEFSELIIDNKASNADSEEISSEMFMTPEVERDYSVDEIADLIDKYMFENNKDFYTKSDD